MSEDKDTLEDDSDDLGALPEVWQITMADMSMLLLIFFVFLYSLATIRPDSVAETLNSVRERLKTEAGPEVKTPGAKAQKEKILEQLSMREQMVMRERQVYEDLTAYFKGRGESLMKTKLDGPRLTITVSTKGMFDNNDVTVLTEEGKKRLKTVADFLARHPDQRVHIKGFTDDTPPPPGSRFRNNWEVSSLQAVSALRYLLSLGVPANRLTSTGLADLEPLLPNTTLENRERNRRLEFVMEVQVAQ